MKYRIVKLPMWRVVGIQSWHGYTEAYVIEKKGWWGWSTIPDTHHISLIEAEKHLQEIIEGKYDNEKCIVREYEVERKDK